MRNETYKTLRCTVCNRSFRATRSHAKYCTENCRQKAKRQRQRAAYLDKIINSEYHRLKLVEKSSAFAADHLRNIAQKHGRAAYLQALQACHALLADLQQAYDPTI